MAYIDYEFYTGTFGGSDVPQEDFTRLAQMASDIVDAIVYRPISEVTERVKRAVCYEMDMLFAQGGADAANGQSSGEISYEMLGDFDPYSIRDLQKLHGVMTYLTVQESGVFRTHNEGVFNGDRCIFMAPPPELVPGQVQALFSWMQAARDSVHPLILSSVFHYEFVFIHPFSDGNGRMARLWQTALLSQWNLIFQYLPLESHIYAFQEAYYAAVAACHTVGRSDDFIEFMLDMIDRTLDRALEQVAERDAYLSESVQKLLDAMEYDAPYSAAQLMARLHLKSKDSFRKHYLLPALEKRLIVMSIPDKPTSRNQTYIKK